MTPEKVGNFNGDTLAISIATKERSKQGPRLELVSCPVPKCHLNRTSHQTAQKGQFAADT